MTIKMTLYVEGRARRDFPAKHFTNEKSIEEFKKNSIKAIREKLGLSDEVEVVFTITGLPANSGTLVSAKSIKQRR